MLGFIRSRTYCWHKSNILKWRNYSRTCVWDCGFDTRVTHDAKRYLEWPMLFDTHYPGITRTRQAWTYFPFLQYNLNKELHYSSGIFRRSLGLICPKLHPWVTSQLPGLLHLPVKHWLSTSLLNNKHDLSCHWEWPAVQTCILRWSCLLKMVPLKVDQGDNVDSAGN